MRRYLIASILGMMIGFYATNAVRGNSEREITITQEFSAFIANESLNAEYRAALLFSDSVRKIYFIQSLPEKPEWYPDYNIAILNHM